jgi:hypothetical protein
MKTLKNKRRNKHKTRSNKKGGMFKPNIYDLDKTPSRREEIQSIEPKEEMPQDIEVPQDNINLKAEIDTLRQEIEMLKSQLIKITDTTYAKNVNENWILVGFEDFVLNDRHRVNIPIFANKQNPSDKNFVNMFNLKGNQGQNYIIRIILPNANLFNPTGFRLDNYANAKDFEFLDENNNILFTRLDIFKSKSEKDQLIETINEKYPGFFWTD